MFVDLAFEAGNDAHHSEMAYSQALVWVNDHPYHCIQGGCQNVRICQPGAVSMMILFDHCDAHILHHLYHQNCHSHNTPIHLFVYPQSAQNCTI